MIVATAGHIDHGKTALVKALTGIDADRLPEEKKRGITVDLGFAYTRSRTGRSIGFVDVPGHEKLVRTMLAGATGVDFVILAIAADDGVMPQTREHLAILDLLGLRRGVVALTKIDRVGSERRAAAIREAENLIAGSGLRGAPLLPVSAHRGDGLTELADLLGEAAEAVRMRAAGGWFRLAVDRAFTLPGTGLVTTGTVHSGRATVGDRLLLSPPGREVRVRGLRVQNERAESGAAGERCALNISGSRVEKSDVGRGAWLLASPIATPTNRADVRLRLLSTELRALRHWTPVHVHVGSADLVGRVALLDCASVKPGESALGQIVLDEPTVAVYGDRFVLRDQSAQRTMGGGWIIDPAPPARNARKPERLAALEALDHVDAGTALDASMVAQPGGLDRERFGRVRNLRPDEIDALLMPRAIVEAEGPGAAALLFSAAAWNMHRAAVLAALDTHAIRHPDSFGATRLEVIRSATPMLRPAMAAALNALLAEKAVVRIGELVQLPGHAITLGAADEARWAELRDILAAAGLDPLRLSSIAETLRLTEPEIKPLLETLGRMGRLTRVSKAYFVLPSVVAELARAAERCAAEHPDAILTVGQFREATGISRHATMPVLEFFDRIGLTRRHQDGRRLRTAASSLFAGTDPADAGSR